jgi:hypothetical protein
MIGSKIKEALKHKMGKTINIEISLKGDNDPKAEQSSDLAPTVKDSDKPGVEKGEMISEDPHSEVEDLDGMIEKQSKGSALAQSLHGRAREKMMAKRDMLKKGLKS